MIWKEDVWQEVGCKGRREAKKGHSFTVTVTAINDCDH